MKELIIDHIDILTKAERCMALYSKRDREFLVEIRNLVDRFGVNAGISFSQLQWLERLGAMADDKKLLMTE